MPDYPRSQPPCPSAHERSLDDPFSVPHQSGGINATVAPGGPDKEVCTPTLTDGTSFLMLLQVSTPSLSTTATCRGAGTVVVTCNQMRFKVVRLEEGATDGSRATVTTRKVKAYVGAYFARLVR